MATLKRIFIILCIALSTISCNSNEKKAQKAEQEYKLYEQEEFKKLPGEFMSYPLTGGGMSGQFRVHLKLTHDKKFVLAFSDFFTGNLIERISGKYSFIPEVGGCLYSGNEQVGTFSIESYDSHSKEVKTIMLGSEYELHRD